MIAESSSSLYSSRSVCLVFQAEIWRQQDEDAVKKNHEKDAKKKADNSAYIIAVQKQLAEKETIKRKEVSGMSEGEVKMNHKELIEATHARPQIEKKLQEKVKKLKDEGTIV